MKLDMRGRSGGSGTSESKFPSFSRSLNDFKLLGGGGEEEGKSGGEMRGEGVSKVHLYTPAV